jgi:hypothetical protein
MNSFSLLKSNIFATCVALLLVLFSAPTLVAQSGTTTVNGTVTDPQGQIIAGASVTLSNAEKGFTRTVTTGDNGTFTFPVIQPGTYALEVEASNFKKFVQTQVQALVDTPTNVAAVLEVGNVTETVTVSGNTAETLLNTQDATVGNTIVSQQVTQLPVEGRNVLSLLTLQPGVTRFGYVAGNRSDQSNVTLDGVDVNEAQTNDINSPVLRLNSEAISEFRVTTTTANSAQGRSSGAQVSLITKSGTNNLRGAVFLTGRRTAWSSNNFFNNKAGVPREKFDREVFGGALGGPLWKDRAFFFYSYEGQRDRREINVLRDVPLPNLGQGIVRFNATNGQTASLTCAQITTIFPATQGCNPVALAVLADAARRYPANDFTVGDGINTAGFRFNAPVTVSNNSHIARFDFNITSKQQAFLRGNYINDVESSTSEFPDTPTSRLWEHPWGFVAGHTWTISNNIVNNFRYGLTRDAFSSQGDSDQNGISFRFVFSPLAYTRTISRETPVQNITNDLSYLWKNHTFQFGTNIRLIRNRRTTFANAFDSATTNPSFYPAGGQSITNPINTFLQSNGGIQIASSGTSGVQNAVTAVVGRYTQYASNFTFLRDGSLTPAGTPSERDFRTEEYDFYAQDIWKLSQNLTITAGLRYGLSRPVYEATGYEVKPEIGLGEYFRRRAEGAASGIPYNEPIVLNLSGAANGKSPLYKWDKNNFQPRIAAAWSPSFGENWLGTLFGRNNESVIRGGFAMTNDYFGQALAVRFDLNNTLGFSSSSQIRANQYNLTTNVGPRFTSFNQGIRDLPNIALPVGNLTFPRQAPTRAFPTAIEGGLDEDLVAPTHYTWSLTYERTLPLGFIVQASYLGREARNLLQSRDTAAIANFVDSQSGTDWYTAATQLEVLRQQGAPTSAIQQIPYFANLFPSNLSSQLGCNPAYNQTQAVYALVTTGAGNCGTFYGNDWTSAQLDLSLLSSRFPGQHIFYQPQYGTLGAFSTIGRSNYHAGTVSVRQRLGTRLTMDFNYTLSKTMDEGSGLQSGAVTTGAGFLLNPFRQKDMYALADFDMKHIVNFNGIFKLPVGRGEPLLGGVNKFVDAIIGGWQMTGIYRYNSGLPFYAPYDDARWATNWNSQSYGTRVNGVQPCPTRGEKFFGCNTTEAYRSFRNAYPGETGDRNVFRRPGYWVLDMGLGKTFTMPWGNSERPHALQFRWEAFNITNTQHMGAIDTSRSGYGIGLDVAKSGSTAQPPPNWSNFTDIQGDRRIMQFVLRYNF